MLKRWKEEWLKSKEKSLTDEFKPKLDDIKRGLDSTLSELNSKKLELESKISSELELVANRQFELSKISQSLEIKSIEIKHKELSLGEAYSSLEREYKLKVSSLESTFNQLALNYDDRRKALESRISEQTSALENDMKDLELLKESYVQRRKTLVEQDRELSERLKVLEAKTSPSNSWLYGFTAGFNKAWDMMIPIMSDGVVKQKKFIEDAAMNRVLEGLNGNNKKTN